jgi:hypothetical protein
VLEYVEKKGRQIMATIDISGDWGTLRIQQNGTQVTAIATVANPHFKQGDGVLVEDVLQMTFTGGQYVQASTGKVSSNGREIKWSNGTIWRR